MNITKLKVPALLACLAAACTPLQSPFANPEKTVRDFHRNLLFRDCKHALEQLTDGTRAKIAQLSKLAAQQSGGAIADDPAAMICQGDVTLYRSEELSGDDVVKVTLTSRDDQAGKAVVTAVIGGKEWPTALIRDAAGDWKIDLESLADEALARRAGTQAEVPPPNASSANDAAPPPAAASPDSEG